MKKYIYASEDEIDYKIKDYLADWAKDDVKNGNDLASFGEFKEELEKEGIKVTHKRYDYYTKCYENAAKGEDVKSSTQVKASQDCVISGVHCMERSSFGGFVNDVTFTGTKAELLSKAARRFKEYYANPEDRFIILLCESNIAHTNWVSCTSSDDFYDAEEIATDWIDPMNHQPAREYVMQKHYYASIIDTQRCREIFYDTGWQLTEEDL